MAAPTRINLQLYKSLLKELKTIYKKDKLRDSSAYIYITEQFRNHEVTSEKVCRGKYEMEHMADTYRCLLQSVRQHQELIMQYKGKGESSIAASAARVGLRLPETITDPPAS